MNTAEKMMMSRITLNELLAGMQIIPAELQETLEVMIEGVQMDSRLIEPGDLFCACFGRNHDARDYIGTAIANGAVAILAESGGSWQGWQLQSGVPIIAVDDLAAKISQIAGRFFADPSSTLSITGITGTNGKTSCSQFLAQSLNLLGRQCGVIGTLGYGFCGAMKDTGYTTPDAVQLQSILAELRASKADSVAMEVSSQGLHQHRVDGIRFHTAVFTNLTRDHLDYHDSMEAYGKVKRRLFEMDGLRTAVVNVDDPYAPQILNNISSSVRSLTYSLSNNKADVHGSELILDKEGYRVKVETPWGNGVLTGSLLGEFNISNVLAVLTVLMSLETGSRKWTLAEVLAVLPALKPVSGRMEIINDGEDIAAVVDYAHTPDALASALRAIRQHYEGNIWCVFGCGGNRDQGKRPLMAEVAGQYADHIVVTDDNPRTECADDIVRQIMLGAENSSRFRVIRDRSKAIATVIRQANPGDVVLIAGKGHENYQDVGGKRTIFSDVNQVRLALQKRSNS
ncbi:MAG: UDP-N-acetylmuramoyl-L-alanyl-D-glutamate--2,6-diaminopimelate ligase [Pseudomonadales bacterium]|nr:UDP-N-acetylmuramoyl-L-alanyl-D-glutamate--2,6-diaminopimelate ligase [Pseudomonadales bacterium]